MKKEKGISSLIVIIIILVVIIGAGGTYYFLTRDTQKSTVCTEEAKVCSDGSAVGRAGPNCEFTPCPKEDLIIVESPSAHEVIKSPLTIKGLARGSWFFEGTFPIEILDVNGNIIAQNFAQANNDWMTSEFVPFEAVLTFDTPNTEKGTIVLKKDNPSGLTENEDELRIPISFDQRTRAIQLYYYNSEMDKDETGNIKCSRDGLVAVERKIPITQTPIQDAIKLLISGDLTSSEKAQGVSTEYPFDDFSLKGASLKDGVLTLEFNDPKNNTTGGSCRVSILWSQIEATAKQFPEVQQVHFLPEDIFQP